MKSIKNNIKEFIPKNSSYIEKFIEHRFIFDLAMAAFTQFDKKISVSYPEVDDSGYDLIIECNNVIRHIQLKTSFNGSRTKVQKVHKNLEKTSGGCVLWLFWDIKENDNSIEFHYLYFGKEGGKNLPSLTKFPHANQNKHNANGEKSMRISIKKINKSKFKPIADINELFMVLFKK